MSHDTPAKESEYPNLGPDKPSKTPRTDALETECAGWDKLRWIPQIVAKKLFVLARQLERELSAAQEKLAALEAAGELACTDAKEELMGCFRAVRAERLQREAETKLAAYESAGKELQTSISDLKFPCNWRPEALAEQLYDFATQLIGRFQDLLAAATARIAELEIDNASVHKCCDELEEIISERKADLAKAEAALEQANAAVRDLDDWLAGKTRHSEHSYYALREKHAAAIAGAGGKG